MTMGMNEDPIQMLQNTLQLLFAKYSAALSQKSRTLNDVDKVVLDQQIKQIESEIKTTQAALDALRLLQSSPSRNYRQVSRGWEEELHKIDYSRVESGLNTAFSALKQREGSALFLIRKSRPMGGKWCIQKVKHHIQSHLGNVIVSRSIGFSAFQKMNSVEFLNRLAEQFAVDVQPTPTNAQSYIQTIIDKIFNSLTSGNIFLLEIDIYTLNPQDTFLTWFVNKFWLPLVSQLPAVSSHKHKVRLIAILAIRSSIPKPCLPATICCNRSSFNGGKILELKLQKWTEVEIRDWLFEFSGLTVQSNRLADEAIIQMAEYIHQETNGLPNDVYHELMDAMTQCAC